MIRTILVEDDLYMQKHFAESLHNDGQFELKVCITTDNLN